MVAIAARSLAALSACLPLQATALWRESKGQELHMQDGEHHPSSAPTRVQRLNATDSPVLSYEASQPHTPEGTRSFLRRIGMESLDPSLTISSTVLNNLGGVGPDISAAPYIMYDNVGFLADGNTFSLRLRNTSEYTCLYPEQNSVRSEDPHFAQLNIKSNSYVRLVGEFVNSSDGEVVEVPTFWLGFPDLSNGGKLRKVVQARPDRFWLNSRARNVEVIRDNWGVLHFSSNLTVGTPPPSYEELFNPKYAPIGNIVVLMYNGKSKFDLTLEVQGGLDSRNFMFVGGSQSSVALLEAGLVTAAIPPNADGSLEGPIYVETMALPPQVLEGATVVAGAAWPATYAGIARPVPQRIPQWWRWISWINWTEVRGSGAEYRIPQPVVQPGITVCASTRMDGKAGCPECVYSADCTCTGWVRMGYGAHWTKWQSVADYINCEPSHFATGDPWRDHGKLCECSVHAPADEPVQVEPVSGWWKPVVITCGFAIPVVILLGLAQTGCIGGAAAPVLEAGGFAAAGHATMLAVAFIMSAKGSDPTLDSGEQPEAQEAPSLRRISQNTTLDSRSAVYPNFAQDQYINVACYVASIFFVLQMFARLMFENLVAKPDQRQDRHAVRAWRSINHFTVAIMYIAIAVILVGDIIDKDVILTTAELCAYSLMFGYFGVHLVFYIVSLELENRYAAAVSKLSALNLAFAPMVALLCMIVQVQADSVEQYVTSDQEVYMKAATLMVLIQALIASVQPLIFPAHLVEMGHVNQEDLVMKRNKGLLYLSGVIRWFIVLYIYYVCYRLISGLWGRADLASEERTKWVDAFTVVYFAANLVQWTIMTLRQFHCLGSKAVHFGLVLQHIVAPLPVIVALIVGDRKSVV